MPNMFSARHYEAIALMVRECDVNLYTKRRIVADLVDLFKADNPRFDRARFYDACDVPLPVNRLANQPVPRGDRCGY